MSLISPRATKLALSVFGATSFALIMMIASWALAVLAFAAPTRPGWALAGLIGVMIVIPVGISLTLLIRSLDAIASTKVRRSLTLMLGALLSPIIGGGLGVGLVALRWLP